MLDPEAQVDFRSLETCQGSLETSVSHFYEVPPDPSGSLSLCHSSVTRVSAPAHHKGKGISEGLGWNQHPGRLPTALLCMLAFLCPVLLAALQVLRVNAAMFYLIS